MSVSSVLKAVLYVLTAVGGGLAADLFDGDGMSGAEWVNLAVVGLTAAVVFLKGNTPTQPWAKAVVAIVGAGVTVLASAWTDQRIDPVEIQQIVFAVLAAVAVAFVANPTTTAAAAAAGKPGHAAP
jgi:uncharacterized membrane protein YfcA